MTMVFRLIDLNANQLKLLQTLVEKGAASANELAVWTNRVGEDLLPDIKELLDHGLIEEQRLSVRGNDITVYLADRAVKAAFLAARAV